MLKDIIILLKIIICALIVLIIIGVVGTFTGTAGELETKLCQVVPISSDLDFQTGEGLEVNWWSEKGFGLFGSYDINPLDYEGSSIGNLNLVVLGAGYQKSWEYGGLFAKCGYVNPHDSDMEQNNTFITTTTTKKKCTQVTTSYLTAETTKIKFEPGYSLEAGFNLQYPFNERWTGGLFGSGRYIKMEREISHSVTNCHAPTYESNKDDLEKIDGKIGVFFNYKF